MRSLAVLVVATVTLAASAQTPVDYRFDEVRRNVTLKSGLQESRVAKGHFARGGDLVRTGWFSYALLAAEKYKARFAIFSATDVRLAEGTPGVILSLERGTIRAVFDKITGSEPRIVKTPGALLAVRGTQFDVHVTSDGATTVDVFEGVVELRWESRPEPVFVRAGEQTVYGREREPMVRPLPDRRRGGEDHGGMRAPKDPKDPKDPADPNRQPPPPQGQQPPTPPSGQPKRH